MVLLFLKFYEQNVKHQFSCRVLRLFLSTRISQCLYQKALMANSRLNETNLFCIQISLIHHKILARCEWRLEGNQIVETNTPFLLYLFNFSPATDGLYVCMRFTFRWNCNFNNTCGRLVQGVPGVGGADGSGWDIVGAVKWLREWMDGSAAYALMRAPPCRLTSWSSPAPPDAAEYEPKQSWPQSWCCAER